VVREALTRSAHKGGIGPVKDKAAYCFLLAACCCLSWCWGDEARSKQ